MKEGGGEVSAAGASNVPLLFSEVSKRGWRTEGVGARKVPFFLCTPRRRGTHFWRFFGALFGVCLSPTPSRHLSYFGVPLGGRGIL